MSILISSGLVQKAARASLPYELSALTCSFSSSSVDRAFAKKQPTSRKRLAGDLQPRGNSKSSGSLEVASHSEGKEPKKWMLKMAKSREKKAKARAAEEEAAFIRDSVPHREATDRFAQPREPFRRRRPLPETRGRWGTTPPAKSEKPWSTITRPERATDTRAVRHKDKPSQPEAVVEPAASSKPKVFNPLTDDFDRSVAPEPVKSLPSEFTSPPLMPGLLDSVVDVLGPHATPTPIQGLAIKHLMYPWKTKEEAQQMKWREFLLASETGSGKSIAYLLPLLQDLKTSELASEDSVAPHPRDKNYEYSPRALILAPTHELSRQLAVSAKALSHNIKMRVVCASRANTPSTLTRNVTASKMSHMFDNSSADSELDLHARKARPLDILVGTPSKLLEMVRGHGWNWEAAKDHGPLEEKGKYAHKFVVGKPMVGLHRVEWVIVDEADVLFDNDFVDSTKTLLSDIAAARPKDTEDAVSPEPEDAVSSAPAYPFNLVFNSATIPASLATYLDKSHRNLKRLVSPNLHHLPSTLKTEYAQWSGGNRNADIESRIKRIWHADTHQGEGHRSKVLVFCNKSTRVEELGRYLTENGMPNVALTSTAEVRHRGNNHHLDGFVRTTTKASSDKAEAATAADDTTAAAATAPSEAKPDDQTKPHVLITTSLLSRGLDFSPEIKNVIMLDSPRNMIDFLHRAGRTARAGQRGTVVIFGKAKGRGSARDKEVKTKVKAFL